MAATLLLEVLRVRTANLGCCLHFSPLNITHPAVLLLKTALQCKQRESKRERERVREGGNESKHKHEKVKRAFFWNTEYK